MLTGNSYHLATVAIVLAARSRLNGIRLHRNHMFRQRDISSLHPVAFLLTATYAADSIRLYNVAPPHRPRHRGALCVLLL